MTQTQTLADKFFAGATIAYRCWGYELGNIFAKWDRRNEAWLFRHETDAEWSREAMTEYRARAIFPTDAREVPA